jgi:hypothetical protein
MDSLFLEILTFLARTVSSLTKIILSHVCQASSCLHFYHSSSFCEAMNLLFASSGLIY